MAEYRITYWRNIPALVTAREGGHTAKTMLPDRFQEAIDAAAMELGLHGSSDYLEQWRNDEWTARPGEPAAVAAEVAARLDADYPPERLEEVASA